MILMEIKLDVIPQTTKDFFTDVRVPPIRSTPLSTLDECPRKFMYQAVLGIHPKSFERPLTVGSFVHLTLARLFMGDTEEQALAATADSLAASEAKLMKWADPAGFLPDGTDLKSSLNTLHEDYHKARAISLVFWRFRPFDTSKWEVLCDPSGQPMVERHLDHELSVGWPKTLLRTTCDLALVNKQNGEVWIVDFKTTTFDARKRSIPTRFSPQIALYRLGLQMELDKWGTNQRVAGSFHAIIQKPGIKCGTQEDQDNAEEWNCTVLEAYVRRLVQWYKNKEAKDPSSPPLILDPNRFHKGLMTSELWQRLERYVEASNRGFDPNYFYRAGESACFKFNRVCPFMVLCNSDPVMWPELVRSMYEIRFREDEEREEV